MKKSIKSWIASIVITLSIMTSAVLVTPVANAAPAHALSTWYVERWNCDWVNVYLHYDYNWWEELQGYRDKDVWQYSYYKYNYYCHNLVPY